MTFKESLQEDLAIFTNPEEFGETALFSRSGENINIILDKDRDEDTGRVIDVVLASHSDTNGLQIGDTFTVGSVVYRNVTAEPTPIGELMLMIRVENESV